MILRKEEEPPGGSSIKITKPTGAWCRKRNKIKGILTMMVKPCHSVAENTLKNIVLRVDIIKYFKYI